MEDFATTLTAHLAKYKREVLGVTENGIWVRNGRKYNHILPQSLYKLNLVEGIRDACLAHDRVSRIQLHRDFHHLNSSQAFALNLFFPLLGSVEPEPQLLLDALGFPSSALVAWEFEAVPDYHEGTNFDLLLTLSNGNKIFIEVKLTEREFGTARNDKTHRVKRDTVYRPRLERNVLPQAFEDEVFFRQYQLMRNISYAGPAGAVVLLFPKANASIRQQAERFLQCYLQPQLRHSVRIVHAEELIAALLRSPRLPTLARGCLEEVASKYTLGHNRIEQHRLVRDVPV
jgi:hypothetical protein